MQTAAYLELQSLLDSGERLHWSGQPRPISRFDFGLIAFTMIGLFFTGLGIFGSIRNYTRGTSVSGVLVPLVFSVAGAGIVCYSQMVEPRSRRKTFYGVTNQRIILVTGVFQQSVQQYALDEMHPQNVLIHRDGRVQFADFQHPCGEDNDRICMPGFSHLENATAVGNLIRTAVVRRREVMEDAQWTSHA